MHLDCFCESVQSAWSSHQFKKILHQPPQNINARPDIFIDNTRLRTADHFLFLGSLLSSKATIDKEVRRRLSCASGAYSRLKKTVFEDRNLQTKTKILVYKGALLHILLYGSEAWARIGEISRFLKWGGFGTEPVVLECLLCWWNRFLPHT